MAVVAKESATVIDSMGIYSMKHEAGKAGIVLSRDRLLSHCCYLFTAHSRQATDGHTW